MFNFGLFILKLPERVCVCVCVCELAAWNEKEAVEKSRNVSSWARMLRGKEAVKNINNWALGMGRGAECA